MLYIVGTLRTLMMLLKYGRRVMVDVVKIVGMIWFGLGWLSAMDFFLNATLNEHSSKYG